MWPSAHTALHALAPGANRTRSARAAPVPPLRGTPRTEGLEECGHDSSHHESQHERTSEANHETPTDVRADDAGGDDPPSESQDGPGDHEERNGRQPLAIQSVAPKKPREHTRRCGDQDEGAYAERPLDRRREIDRAHHVIGSATGSDKSPTIHHVATGTATMRAMEAATAGRARP